MADPTPVVSPEQRSALKLSAADVKRVEAVAAISPNAEAFVRATVARMVEADDAWTGATAERTGNAYMLGAFLHALIRRNGKGCAWYAGQNGLKSPKLREIAAGLPARESGGDGESFGL